MTVFVTLPRPRDAHPNYRAPVALKVVALEVCRDDTVATVKARLHRMERIPPLRQRLLFACSALPDDDGTTLAEHGVTDSSSIQLVETKMQLFVRCTHRPNVVTVAAMAYSPASVTISPGDTVTWFFDDTGVAHNVVGIDAASRLLHSPMISSGQFSQTFDDPGTYPYFCSVHPNMTGTVIVK
jgi:plastocyanin